MQMKFRRIIAALSACLLLCGLFTACGRNSGEDNRPPLRVWVLSEDYKADLERATETAFTSIDWRLEVEVVGTEELYTLLEEQDSHTGGQPDVFMLPPDLLAAFTASEVTADLGALGLEFDPSRYYGYTIDAGTSADGILKAACYEADPGLFFYRRSLAEYYLGTDDPGQIQDMLCDWDGFLQTARTLSEASNGNTYMVVGVEELMMPYLSGTSLVKDGQLSIGEKPLEFMEYCRAMASEELIFNAQQWSDAWIAGISDPQSVFGYFSSGLGMENVLKPCCGGSISGEGSYGDWAAVPGPAAYNWGGCWFAVHSQSSMTEEAALFVEHFTCEEAAMRTDRLISGSFSANRTVVEQIKFDSQFTESFLSAQNCYNMMAQTADNIVMDDLTVYDSIVEPIFAQCVTEYAFGQRTLEQTLSDIERTIQAVYPELVG